MGLGTEFRISSRSVDVSALGLKNTQDAVGKLVTEVNFSGYCLMTAPKSSHLAPIIETILQVRYAKLMNAGKVHLLDKYEIIPPEGLVSDYILGKSVCWLFVDRTCLSVIGMTRTVRTLPGRHMKMGVHAFTRNSIWLVKPPRHEPASEERIS